MVIAVRWCIIFLRWRTYYQDQGRDWERYALIKARPVSGDPGRAEELMILLQPFVYRRYVDYGVIESLRGMKEMINAEVRRRGLQDNIKLGHGGIREVEFIAQCVQLIRGGRDRVLQQRELLPVLQACADLGDLPASVCVELCEAYLFLRDTEHSDTGLSGSTEPELPVDTLPRSAMAHVMGMPDWDSFKTLLDRIASALPDISGIDSRPDGAGRSRGAEARWSLG